MSHRFFSGLLTITSLFLGLTGCGGGGSNDGSQAPVTVGLYRSSTEKLKTAGADFFIVTANQDIYLLTKDQTLYRRAYKGHLGSASYKYNNGHFESGDIEGDAIASTDASVPAALQVMASVNESTSQLLKALNEKGFKVEFRLELTNPGFNAGQKEIIDRLTTEVDVLVTYLKDKGLEQFWINDFTNTKMYTKEKRLHLPGALGTVRGDDVITNLKTSTNIDQF